jgi:hypothetical protein
MKLEHGFVSNITLGKSFPLKSNQISLYEYLKNCLDNYRNFHIKEKLIFSIQVPMEQMKECRFGPENLQNWGIN